MIVWAPIRSTSSVKLHAVLAVSVSWRVIVKSPVKSWVAVRGPPVPSWSADTTAA